MDISVIAILVIASLIGSGLIALAIRRGGQSEEKIQEFARAQGWRYSQDPQTGTTRLRDLKDDWTLQIIFSGDGAVDGMTHRRVEWHSPHGALPEGEAVLGMPLPEKSVAMMQAGGAFGQQILQASLKATLHALGKTGFDLRIDEDTAGDPGGVVMATPGQETAMNTLRKNVTLADIRSTTKTEAVPVIIRNPDGLTLRRPGAVKDLQDLTVMVDLGKSLRDDL
ncbi:hypothetical protein [uncultured Pelagimonas sp.]|uniref:hypothetical protein n=1 Tax=uncultured Pelagimonas sp. TaxID=1618102 RepID=UPI00261E054E|nr:hypothetical protein [uncultured Pelagimonas sp.]